MTTDWRGRSRREVSWTSEDSASSHDAPAVKDGPLGHLGQSDSRYERKARRHAKLKKRVAHHWRRTLYMQLAAYGVVLALWVLPIPNPVKLLAVTFHEMSHAIMALLTGGRVFGYAIVPGGSGVTLGVGGSMFLILIAGYLGSCLWGVLLYLLSARRKPVECVLALAFIVIASGLFGWLNQYTYFFGGGALFMTLVVATTRDSIRLFFVRMIGSACCLYAPFDVIGGAFNAGGAPKVMGADTNTDVGQLGQLLGVPPFLVGLVILAGQVAILVWLVRTTCTTGAKRAVKEEVAIAKLRHQIMQDIHPEKHRYVIR